MRCLDFGFVCQLKESVMYCVFTQMDYRMQHHVEVTAEDLLLFVKGIALLSSEFAASFSIEILPLKIRLRPCARNRVAKVGKLSVNAIDAFKSFV